jgi:hypothetical protein
MFVSRIFNGIFLGLVIFAAHLSVSGQYCGGMLEYVVRDQKNLIIDAKSVEIFKHTFPADGFYLMPPSSGAIKDYELRKTRGEKGVPASQLSKADLESEKSYRKPRNIESLHLSTIAIRMGCGLQLVELSLKYDGDLMKLRFVNVREMDAVLDSVPFQSGTFEIDFDRVYNGYPTDKSNFNLEGLRSGDEFFLPWHARGNALIDSKNWRRK